MIVNIGTIISTMKNDDRQQQRAVDPLLLVAQVHEHRGHHRALDRRDDQRDGDRQRHGEVDLVDRDRDDGEHEQRRADHHVGADALLIAAGSECMLCLHGTALETALRLIS